MEIYKHHAKEYDELVTHEDVENNLGKWLKEHIRWEDKVVVEAGAGTGRVTALYIPYVKKAFLHDRSAHMLDRLRKNLEQYTHKFRTNPLDHLDIFLNQPADIFIEGWSFGHLMIEHKKHLHLIMDKMQKMIDDNLQKDGKAIIIETLGTNVTAPNPPEPILAYFYKNLESKLGYKRHVIRTDYEFPSVEEAARIMGFFFGDAMNEKILQEQKYEIEEYTGIWIR